MKRNFLCGLALLAVSCGGGNGGDFEYDRRALLQGVTNQVILPVYAQLETRAAALETAVTAYCAAPSAATLGAAQDAWRTARVSVKRNESFDFGPAEDLRISQAIDFWPIRTDSIEAAIAAGNFSQAAIDGLGTSAKGLPVIEYLMFRPQTPATGRRCEYLQALAINFAARSRQLNAAWQPSGGDYSTDFIEAGTSASSYVSQQAAVDRLVNHVLFLSEEVADNRLGFPAGRRTSGVPQPDLCESRFSDNSLRDALETLRGIEAIYLVSGGGGLSAIVAQRDADLDAEIRQQIQRTFQAVSAIPEPLRLSVSASQAVVTEAFTQVKALQRLLNADLANLLGVTVVFNPNDGD